MDIKYNNGHYMLDVEQVAPKGCPLLSHNNENNNNKNGAPIRSDSRVAAPPASGQSARSATSSFSEIRRPHLRPPPPPLWGWAWATPWAPAGPTASCPPIITLPPCAGPMASSPPPLSLLEPRVLETLGSPGVTPRRG
eukprot:5557113-Pyramimonas_sp.AAC.2